MNSKNFALLLGIVYTVVGVLGFVPGILSTPPVGAPDLRVDAGYGYLLGLFPVNVIHSLVHLATGVWGLMAARSLTASRAYARSLAFLFGALTIMGVLPGLRTLFGLTPLFGHDVWLHALTALTAAYFGFRREWAADVARDRERRAA